VDVLVLHHLVAVAQFGQQRVPFEPEVPQGALHGGVQVEDFGGRVDLLLGTQLVELEFVVAVGELAFLEHFHELVLAHLLETLEALLQEVCHVAVEDCRHLEVDVQFELRRFVHVHVEVESCDEVDVFHASDGLPGLGVELVVLAEPLLLDHILLEDAQDVSAVVEHALLVGLLAQQFDGDLEVVGRVLVRLHQLPLLVRLRLDDLDQRVVVDLSSEEHLLEFALDAEGCEDPLTQVEVLLNRDGELSLLLVQRHHAHLLEEHCLREGEVGQVAPNRVVVDLLALELSQRLGLHLHAQRKFLT